MDSLPSNVLARAQSKLRNTEGDAWVTLSEGEASALAVEIERLQERLADALHERDDLRKQASDRIKADLAAVGCSRTAWSLFPHDDRCYCGCTDGDPKACAGWQGWQDEPPCRCACHVATSEASSAGMLQSDANPLRDAISWLRGIKHTGDNGINLGLTIGHLQNILARLTSEPPAVQRKFLDLPKGTRFRYIGGKDVWVVLENYGLGLIAAWHGIEHGNKHQSLCIADETEEAVRNLVVEVVEGHAPPPEALRDELARVKLERAIAVDLGQSLMDAAEGPLCIMCGQRFSKHQPAQSEQFDPRGYFLTCPGPPKVSVQP